MERNPYSPPESRVADAAEGNAAAGAERPTRGGCLVAFLGFMVVANAAVALIYFAATGTIAAQFPRLTEGLVRLLGVAALLNVLWAILVWRWFRLGVYGLIVMSVFAFSVNIYVGVPALQAVVGFLGPAILALLVRKKWSWFR